MNIPWQKIINEPKEKILLCLLSSINRMMPIIDMFACPESKDLA